MPQICDKKKLKKNLSQKLKDWMILKVLNK